MLADWTTGHWYAVSIAGLAISGLWAFLLSRIRTDSLPLWRTWFWVSLGLTWTPFALGVLLPETEGSRDRVAVDSGLFLLGIAGGMAVSLAWIRWLYLSGNEEIQAGSLFKWLYSDERDSRA